MFGKIREYAIAFGGVRETAAGFFLITLMLVMFLFV